MKRLLVALLLAGPALGDTLPWLEIRAVDFLYRDAGWRCETTLASASLYLSGEVEDGRLTRAYLRKAPTWPEAAELSGDELAGTGLFRDDRGRYFLTRLTLDGRHLAWVYHTLTPLIACIVAPPRALRVSPDPIAFEFELEAVKEGVGVSYSDLVKFSGENARGSFSARLKLKQRQW